MDFYSITDRVSHLYAKLQDNLSKDVFWARLQYDIHPSASGMLRLWELSGIPSGKDIQEQKKWKKTFQDLLKAGKQIYLYGAGLRGTQVAADILHDECDFSGFIDQDYNSFQEPLFGKRVYSPDYLFTNQNLAYIVITTVEYQEEISNFLVNNGFPRDHILSYFEKEYIEQTAGKTRQYFEFRELFLEGTAFIDGGSFNGADSLYFAEWCGGKYSKIFTFEPDAKNFQRCKKSLAHLKNVSLLQAGLGEHFQTALFSAVGKGHSRLSNLSGTTGISDQLFQNADVESVEICALDDLTADEKVGFIKMDIEGAEMQALRGAKSTICRDKPLLAICVYHRPGDVLEIMNYLSDIVPEYRFWLRHYELYANETVLYAAV